MINRAADNPLSYGYLSGVDWWAWFLSHVFATGKFVTLFNLLFGASLVFYTEKWSRDERLASRYAIRMCGLLLIGAAHAYLVWHEDVLVSYAICGLLLFPLRKVRAAWLILAGCVLILLRWYFMLSFPENLLALDPGEKVSYINSWRPSPSAIFSEVHYYHLGWLSQLPERIRLAWEIQAGVFHLGNSGRIFGTMLLGMGLARTGWMRGEKSWKQYLGIAVAGLILGILVIVTGVRYNQAHAWSYMDYVRVGLHFNYWGSFLMAAGYFGLVAFFCKIRPTAFPLRLLARTGSMALTTYVMQSLLCTLFFYGYGLGQFGLLSRWQLLLMALGLCGLQLWLNHLWLQVWPSGPLETLWRWLCHSSFRAKRG